VAVKILVVDDSSTMRKIMEMTFAAESAEIVTVEGMDSALNKLDSFAPDLVFADISMNPDGYEVARAVKSRRPSTAVVALSSQHHPYDAGKGTSAGFDDNVVKPFDSQSVIDRVAQVLAKPRAAAAAAPAGAPAAPKPVAPVAPMGAAPGPRDMKRTMAFGMPLTPVANPVGPVQHATGQPHQNVTSAAIPAAAPMPTAAPVPVAPPPPAAPAAPRVGDPSAASRAVTVQGPAPVSTAAAARPAAPVVPKPAAAAAPAPAVAAPKPAPTPAPRPAVSATPAPSPRPAAAAPAPVAAAGVALPPNLEGKLVALGLTKDQVEGVLALSREVVEQVVWEVVPELAETLIKEEIKRLMAN